MLVPLAYETLKISGENDTLSKLRMASKFELFEGKEVRPIKIIAGLIFHDFC